MTEKNDLLKPEEVAKLLRVHPSTIRSWINEGRIRGIVLGAGRKGEKRRRWYRVPRQSVETLLGK